MFAALLERFTDWRRERRIWALHARISAAFDAGNTTLGWLLANRLFAECDKRSAGQIARMEKAALDRLDPHARAVFDRSRGA
jgi:hypothetical protein